ncbi:hypothetical protein E8E12_006665 [Didymella heteroderae]|uniref:Uncharacterized protein n=1 Tax=Didymella heteroderae TaxID=1769908 RepID=A0A9P4WS27_9PLEO|nr:hypothetical protein E8E12_006665 [Didymella heteroderae]
MAGQKRTRSGDLKAQSKPSPQPPQDVTMTDTPPCGQDAAASKEADINAETNTKTQTKPSQANTAPRNTLNPRTHPTSASKKAASKPTKRPQLPPNATISKRPLVRPAIPTPFASSDSPKVLYITRTTPFIPACKRIRSLLSQIQKRATQSSTEGRGRGPRGKGRGRLEANGRLSAQDVEASIAAEAGRKGKAAGVGIGGEEVYLKATGRAIPRALELGVKFQGDDDCRVRVEMGSVKAIDDVEVRASLGEKGEGKEEEDEEVPETRIRTLSTVTVCIGLA